jgi:hypothetical protein
MASKVIGTGAPRMLTVRFRPCEVDLLLDELHHHRAVVTEAAGDAHAKSAAPGAGAGDDGRSIRRRSCLPAATPDTRNRLVAGGSRIRIGWRDPDSNRGHHDFQPRVLHVRM